MLVGITPIEQIIIPPRGRESGASRARSNPSMDSMLGKRLVLVGVIALIVSFAWTVICGMQWTMADGYPMKVSFLGFSTAALYAAFVCDALSALVLLVGVTLVFLGRRR